MASLQKGTTRTFIDGEVIDVDVMTLQPRCRTSSPGSNECVSSTSSNSWSTPVPAPPLPKPLMAVRLHVAAWLVTSAATQFCRRQTCRTY